MRPLLSRIVVDADWLNAERARLYGGLLTVVLVLLTAGVLLAPLQRGELPGGDFGSFYAASSLALSGHPQAAWIPALHSQAQRAVLGSAAGGLAFYYPPPYLLVCWPLALLPYLAAFFAFAATTLGAAVAALAAFLRRVSAVWFLPLILLVLPGTWVNVLEGQNGALTLAIIAGGFAMIDRRPVEGGLLLGLMVIKPQLAAALPFVLVASGRWRALGAAAASSIGLLLFAWFAVGSDGYAAFLSNSANARLALEREVDPGLIQSVFAMLRPASQLAAYGAQLAIAAAVIFVACVLARRNRSDGPALGALATTATLAATPFLLDYDLALVALPIGWIVASGVQSGFRPWEKLICVICGLYPLLARLLAIAAGVHLGPLVSLLLLLVVARRMLAPKGAATAAFAVVGPAAG